MALRDGAPAACPGALAPFKMLTAAFRRLGSNSIGLAAANGREPCCLNWSAGTSKERHNGHPTLNARADVDSVLRYINPTNLPSTGLCRRRTVEIDSRHGVGVKRDELVIQPSSGTFHEVRIGCRPLELVGSMKSNAGADRRIRKLH